MHMFPTSGNMDSDVFRKLCFGVKFTKKPQTPTDSLTADTAHPQAIENADGEPNNDDASQTETPKDSVPNAKRKRKKKKSALGENELKQEQIKLVRKSHRIHVVGSDVPDPFTRFEELRERYNIHNLILKNLATIGFQEPTPIQMQAVPIMLERRDIMACAPTGSGKTAAFVIPVLRHLREPRNLGFRAVLLAPTRELAKQTLQVCRQLAEGIGFRCHYIEKAAKAARFGPKSKKNFDVLVSTPNRLVFMLQHDPPLLDLSKVEWLVVDEADKLFEDGADGFRNQLAVIYNSCAANTIRRAFFSATFANDVKMFCKETMDHLVEVNVGARNTATHLVKQELLFVGNESGKRFAMRDIINKGIEPPVLIFVQSKDRAKDLFSEFMYDGIMVDVIHADRTQLQRDKTVKAFVEGKIWVLVCTELMGRGIDFKDINLVINYDFPATAVSYIHRIGRTGRAGRPGRAITFFTFEDTTHLRSIANIMKESGCDVPEYMLKLKKPTKNEKKNKFPVKRKRISAEVYDGKRPQKRRKLSEKNTNSESSEPSSKKLKKKNTGAKSLKPSQKKLKNKKNTDAKSLKPSQTKKKGTNVKRSEPSKKMRPQNFKGRKTERNSQQKTKRKQKQN